MDTGIFKRIGAWREKVNKKRRCSRLFFMLTPVRHHAIILPVALRPAVGTYSGSRNDGGTALLQDRSPAGNGGFKGGTPSGLVLWSSQNRKKRWKTWRKVSIRITIRRRLPATVGTRLWPVPQSRIFTWRFAPSAIRSTPALRKQRRPVDVLISSTRNTVLNNRGSLKKSQVGVRALTCFFSASRDW